VVIAEGLHDPTVINDLRVIRRSSLVTGSRWMRTVRKGRWHLYWVDVSDDEIDRIQAGTRHACRGALSPRWAWLPGQMEHLDFRRHAVSLYLPGRVRNPRDASVYMPEIH